MIFNWFEKREVNKIINKYNLKYPFENFKHDFFYSANNNKKPYLIEIPLTEFIFSTNSIDRFLINNKLTMTEYLKKYSYKEAIQTLRYDVYALFVKLKTYRTDLGTFGFTDVWTNPFVSWNLLIDNIRQMDCEDSSILLMALFKSAGIPCGLQRVTCGVTNSGIGHATVTVYDFDLDQWIIYESTVMDSMKIIASDLDPWAIKDVYFSFDWKNCWSNDPMKFEQYRKLRIGGKRK